MDLRAQKLASIVEDLLREGLISLEQNQQFKHLISQSKQGSEWEKWLIDKGGVGERELYERLAKKAGVNLFELSKHVPNEQALQCMKSHQAIHWQIVPVDVLDGRIVVATANPFDFDILDEVRRDLGREIEYVMAPPKDIQKALDIYYGDQSRKNAKQTFEKSKEERSKVFQQPRNQAQTPEDRMMEQVVSTVDDLLLRSVLERASDIHLEPTRKGLQVRVRIDGVLNTVAYLPQDLQEAILSRIKILGGMDVAEHRITQDGRTTLQYESTKEVDVRIATYPTMFGEAAAIRFLFKTLITLDDLGLVGRDREELEKLILRPNGIFLASGPTGSGKTTTLYAVLQKIDRHSKHVLSVEDPIENEIEGVDQTQVNPRAGVTFASSVRAMLRQDPDVIMVGEIRDQETADIAFRSAMTGHLVLSTLHTNSAVASISRLLDLGVEMYLISASLLGVLAQRLVRRICLHCREEVTVQPVLLKALGPRAEGLKTYQGKGCEECRMRGYKGRIGIFELMAVDDEMRVLINNRAPEVRLKEKALSAGFRTMLDDGIDKIGTGITTVEEVLRACGGYGG